MGTLFGTKSSYCRILIDHKVSVIEDSNTLCSQEGNRGAQLCVIGKMPRRIGVTVQMTADCAAQI
jgi:hypothetical protein